MVPPLRSVAPAVKFAQWTTAPSWMRRSAGPEWLETDAKSSGYFAAYFRAPKPPIEKPETARPEACPVVAKVASTQGRSSLMWKVSQLRGPTLEDSGSQYQPAAPPSGMTTMRSRPAVWLRMSYFVSKVE